MKLFFLIFSILTLPLYGDCSQGYDLLISNTTFSAQGYEDLTQISQHGFQRFENQIIADEFVSILLRNGKSGKMVFENGNFLVTWKDTSPFKRKKSPPPYPAYNVATNNTAISYSLSGGRFGDNLVAYFHAKWLAYKQGMPFLYLPFAYSNLFAMEGRDPGVNQFHFPNRIQTQDYRSIYPRDSTLFILPYLPECKCDYRYGLHNYIYVDWEDPVFLEEMISSLTPVVHFNTLQLPEGFVTVGVHVRRGGGVDNLNRGEKRWPLKFPPDSYFIEEIKRIANIFNDRQLYVYIFTDDTNPHGIVESYRNAVNNPRVTFESRFYGNGPWQNVMEDFFSMMKFDCFIRGESNFSIMATKFARYSILISPVSYHVVNGQHVINQTELTFHSQRCSYFDFL